MIYVFEGPRNSGKTFLSNHIAKRESIKRFQFQFADYFKRLGLESQNSKEAHAFSMGKELMILQLFKDVKFSECLIHDRGMLTVLAWGLMENRISEQEMEDQVKMLKDLDVMSGATIIFITGDNPNKSERNKDAWDRIDGDSRELVSYEKVILKFEEYQICKILRFTNNYDQDTLKLFENLFDHIVSDPI